MTTITLPAASPLQAPPRLGLDARLALVDAAMTVRLDQAAIAFEVNTAHLPAAEPSNIADVVPLTPAPALSPYRTPVAGLLHRARIRLETDGWCQDALFDDQGAVCPIRAIRLEARGDRRLADDACVLLLDRIQDDYAWAETIPSWNAEQTSPQPVLRAFDHAAHHAHTRGL